MNCKTATIAIIGRPNVGKSSLFNLLVGKRQAIVSDIPGTTRDNITALVEPETENALPFWIVDTAGLTNRKGENLEDAMQTQAKIAIKNSDLILFLIDGKGGVTAEDKSVIDLLRQSGKPVFFVANKIDDGSDTHLYELAQYGFGIPQAVSAKNNFGFWDLYEAIQKHIKSLNFTIPETHTSPAETIIKLAIIGRPNVGKSSLFNQLIGQDQSIISDVPGTTRDTIDAIKKMEDGTEIQILDTAGLRRPGKVGRDLEFWSTVRVRKSLQVCDVCALLIDAMEGITHLDLAIASEALEAGKALVLCVNKFDLVRKKSQEKVVATTEKNLKEIPMWGQDIEKIRAQYLHYLQEKIGFLPWAPVLFFSAKTGRGVEALWESIRSIAKEREKRISTGELNRLLPEIIYGHVPPAHRGKTGKIKYATQAETAPPTFVFFVRHAVAFHFSYRRYLENKLREYFGFFGTPVRIEIREEKNSRRAS